MNLWIVRCYLWACQRLYAEWAGSYDRVSWLISLGRWSTWRRAALAYLPTPQQGANASPQILEIGFGTGELLIEMTQQRLECYGLDLSWPMQQIVASKAQRAGLSLRQVCGAAQALPFADQTFDAVLATFPASYIGEATTLQAIQRVLRPGGRLIIVGLWVAINQPGLAALLPVFYGQPNAAALAQYQERLNAAGLQTTLDRYNDGLFSVGVIVAQKSAP